MQPTDRSMKFREFLFTGFYSGYSPVAPGTMGTFVAMLIYIAEYYFFREFWLVNSCRARACRCNAVGCGFTE